MFNLLNCSICRFLFVQFCCCRNWYVDLKFQSLCLCVICLVLFDFMSWNYMFFSWCRQLILQQFVLQLITTPVLLIRSTVTSLMRCLWYAVRLSLVVGHFLLLKSNYVEYVRCWSVYYFLIEDLELTVFFLPLGEILFREQQASYSLLHMWSLWKNNW